MGEKQRCRWVGEDPLYIAYHDTEWGTPLYDDRKLFEFLVLECMQAGLSWITVLRKREYFREALDGFDPHVMSRYDDEKLNMLMADTTIIRNRRKLESSVLNARAFIKVQDAFGSFSNYLWGFVDGTPAVGGWRFPSEVPAQTVLSKKLSQDLKGRGFSFVGPTISYAYMQAVGLANDHTMDCFRYRELLEQGR
ncbi:MAG: DNA-3-methyladenine glycosylase I [Desulfobacterales bacterium]